MSGSSPTLDEFFAMSAEPFNPYAPPKPDPVIRDRINRRQIWGAVLTRVLAVVAGFSLVADPTSLPGVETVAGRLIGGYVFARGVGLALLALGFLPWPGRRPFSPRTREIDPQPEEL